MMQPLELHEIDIADEDTPRANPIVKVWTGSGWIVKMIHPHELHEIDFADEDTPRAKHSSKPIVKVWTGSGWVDCDKIAPFEQEQVIYEEPEEEDEKEYSITSKADQDTPHAMHSSKPIVKVWTGSGWVDCDKIAPFEQEQEQVIYEEPDEDEEEYSITSKADKRRREKGTNFAYKQRTNLYIKNWNIAPGYDYPGPASIPHKLITATSAPKIVKLPRGDVKARIARSKAVLRRHDKTAFGPEEDYNFNTTHPRRHHTTWGNLGMIPPGNYYPECRVDFWPRGATCKPVRRSFVDILNTW